MRKIVTEINADNNQITEFPESLRPLFLKDFTGQKDIKKELSLYIKAALERNESLDHILFYGPPGLGKTTLSKIIANEMGARFLTVAAPVIEKTGDLVSILLSLNEKDVLFIDEIHRLPKFIEETLYSAMEDFKVSILIGKEEQAKVIEMNLPRFTLVGATTKAGMLSEPLRNRFGIIEKLEYYDIDELSQVIKRSAGAINCLIEDKAAEYIAIASKGTPREANKLLKRVRDYAQIHNQGVISASVASKYLTELGYDEDGLSKNDRRLLSVINVSYQGGPVGLETLAASLGESSETIETVYEPYLIRNGYLIKTARGRMTTEKAKICERI